MAGAKVSAHGNRFISHAGIAKNWNKLHTWNRNEMMESWESNMRCWNENKAT